MLTLLCLISQALCSVFHFISNRGTNKSVMAKNSSAFRKEFDTKNISREVQRSARSKAIETRSRISSTDYTALEEHDQFYRDHKVLLHLFVLLGVVPVHRRIGRITFQWKSVAFIYAVCLYICTTFLVLMVGYQRVKILTVGSKKFDEYIYSIIFIVYLLPHFTIPFVGWDMADQVVNYKNSWGTYQLRYYRITGKAIEFPKLKILIVIISSGCLILAVVFLLSLSALLAGFTLYHTCAYYHIVTIINMNCALWYINCRAMGDASKSFADSFEEDIGDNCSAYILSKYRILWLALSEMLQKLGNTYARTYSVYSLFMFLNITIAVYGFMSEIIDHGFGFTFKVMGLFVDAVYCITLLYIFCDCSENATINIAKRVQDTLMTIDMNTIEQGAKKEIDLFLVAIQMNPPVVSLKGYADVDKKFFTSNLTMMAIYLIVLLQFKVSFQMMYSATN